MYTMHWNIKSLPFAALYIAFDRCRWKWCTSSFCCFTMPLRRTSRGTSAPLRTHWSSSTSSWKPQILTSRHGWSLWTRKAPIIMQTMVISNKCIFIYFSNNLLFCFLFNIDFWCVSFNVDIQTLTRRKQGNCIEVLALLCSSAFNAVL